MPSSCQKKESYRTSLSPLHQGTIDTAPCIVTTPDEFFQDEYVQPASRRTSHRPTQPASPLSFPNSPTPTSLGTPRTLQSSKYKLKAQAQHHPANPKQQTKQPGRKGRDEHAPKKTHPLQPLGKTPRCQLTYSYNTLLTPSLASLPINQTTKKRTGPENTNFLSLGTK